MSAQAAALFQSASLHSMSKPERWAVRGLSLLLWALAAGVLAYWVLGARSGTGVPAARVADTAIRSNPQQMANLLGHEEVSAAAVGAAVAANRGQFALKGVVADQRGGGLAIIAVGNEPARPVRLGQEVAEGWALRDVGIRSAQLEGRGGQKLELGFPAAGTQASLGRGQVPAFGAAATPASAPVPAQAPVTSASAPTHAQGQPVPSLAGVPERVRSKNDD